MSYGKICNKGIRIGKKLGWINRVVCTLWEGHDGPHSTDITVNANKNLQGFSEITGQPILFTIEWKQENETNR